MSILTPPFIESPLLINPRGLRRWRKALADAENTPARIACWGDSITNGIGWDGTASSGPEDQNDIYAWPSQLRKYFAHRFQTNEAGSITPKGIAAGGDGRVSLGGGAASIGSMWAGLAAQINNAPQTVTINVPVCTTVEVIYFRGDGSNGQTTSGTFKTNIDGGADNNADNSGASQYKLQTIGSLSSSAHSVVLTGTSAANAFPCAVNYHSGKGVLVGRYGRPGWTSLDGLGKGANSTVQSAAGQQRYLWQYGQPNFHLVVIEWGTNDWGSQNTGDATTPSNLQSNVQSMVNQAIGVGACCLLLGPTASGAAPPSPQTYLEAQYDSVLRAIASSTDHCGYVSMSGMFGANAIAEGLQNSGSAHPTRAGHGDIGRQMFNLLTSRYVPMS